MKHLRKMDRVELTLIIVIFVIGIFSCLFMSYSAYGHITQHETITMTVIDKDTYTTTTQNCTTINEMTTCVPITTTHYRVTVEDGETFSISKSLYKKVIVDKKHVFYVTGWVNMRNIKTILE